MDFDLQWLLWAVPLAFALGWLASRLDVWQWKRERRDAPRAYFHGLHLLLNEQQDKAIDAFMQAVQQDPDTSDLHFALGNLFRRRGEYQRAVRVHEHLLQRADLPKAERERAQFALAQDFMKAGLLDRAEAAYRALAGSSYATEARLALLTLHERARDWSAAIAMATELERAAAGSFASRIAHYHCELALEADARHDAERAHQELERAHQADAQAARPKVLSGQLTAAAGQAAAAMSAWEGLLPAHLGAFDLVAQAYARCAVAAGQQATALTQLLKIYEQRRSTELLAAIGMLEPDAAQQRQRLVQLVRTQPGLGSALALASAQPEPQGDELAVLRQALERAAQPALRYRCAACGFESRQYFWQCPGCLAWDSYPPQAIETL